MSSRTAAIMASKEKCKRNRDNWKARALKAEAMCEYLAERLEESDDTVLSADTWLAAAREAVKR